MQNQTSVGITLKPGEPDFMQWLATYHAEEAKMLFNRYLRYIAFQRHTNRGETDIPSSRRPEA